MEISGAGKVLKGTRCPLSVMDRAKDRQHLHKALAEDELGKMTRAEKRPLLPSL